MAKRSQKRSTGSLAPMLRVLKGCSALELRQVAEALRDEVVKRLSDMPRRGPHGAPRFQGAA
jgi:hypothetical protein